MGGAPSPAPASVLESNFRVYGWRWHHLAVVRDLGRVAAAAAPRPLCEAGPTGAAARAELLAAYSHVLDDNWKVHDDVESHLMFPWVGERLGRTRRITLVALSVRRRTASRRREDLRKSLTRLVSTEHVDDAPARVCTRSVTGVRRDLRALAGEAAAMFAAEERLLVPLVAELFSEQEQELFNQRVIRSLSGRQARVALVVFRDAVHGGGGTPQDRRNFERQVPAPVRILVPLWRRKFAHIRIRFFGAN